MEDNNQLESQAELDILPFVCSQCGTEVIPEVEPWPEACPTCLRSFDQKAQLAYSRGQDAFSAGQELIVRLSPKLRKKNLITEIEMESLFYYTQAYTALQESFKGDLADIQLHLGIEMMAAIAHVFLQHDMISSLESSYWGHLLTEVNTHKERKTLLQNLKEVEQNGILGLFQRLRWQIRLSQIEKGLVDLDSKIRTLERNIAFVDPPRARRSQPLHSS